MEIDGEQRVMEPGEFAYVPRNVLHRIQTLDQDALVLDVFFPIREDIAKRLAELQPRHAERLNVVTAFNRAAGAFRRGPGSAAQSAFALANIESASRA